jgi:hypothetical protein
MPEITFTLRGGENLQLGIESLENSRILGYTYHIDKFIYFILSLFKRSQI